MNKFYNRLAVSHRSTKTFASDILMMMDITKKIKKEEEEQEEGESQISSQVNCIY